MCKREKTNATVGKRRGKAIVRTTCTVLGGAGLAAIGIFFGPIGIIVGAIAGAAGSYWAVDSGLEKTSWS